jgi:acetyl esterase/lipase
MSFASERGGGLRRLLVAAGVLLAAGAMGAPSARAGSHRLIYWDPPSGAYRGRPPKLVLMFVHGGGWGGFDLPFVNLYRRTGRSLRSIGYATATLDFRAGGAGIDDIQRSYRRIRRLVGPATPVCALGDSSGGHAALMLATREPGLDCVVALGAPTDLTDLSGAPEAGTIRDLAERAFGADHLADFSPLLHARAIRASLMLVSVETDPLIAPDQALRMARAVPGTQVRILPPGDAPFVHANAAEASVQAYLAARKRFFGRVVLAKHRVPRSSTQSSAERTFRTVGRLR